MLPEEADQILEVEPDLERRETRETRRITRFLERVGRHFPVVDYLERYGDVAYEIPFVRMGWEYERLHEGPEEVGEKLLFVLCAHPYGEGHDTRLPILDSLVGVIPGDLLVEVPDQGFDPQTLHERLDDTRYAALANYAAWLWGETDSLFLDSTDEMEFADAEWSRENFDLLSEDWQRADAILERIAALQNRLLEDPARHFAQLLDACLGNDPHLKYLDERGLYAGEITEEGIVPNPCLDLRELDVEGREREEQLASLPACAPR